MKDTASECDSLSLGMASLKQMQTLLETLQKFQDCNPVIIV